MVEVVCRTYLLGWVVNIISWSLTIHYSDCNQWLPKDFRTPRWSQSNVPPLRRSLSKIKAHYNLREKDGKGWKRNLWDVHLTDLLHLMLLEDPVSSSKGDEHPKTWHRPHHTMVFLWWLASMFVEHLRSDFYYWSFFSHDGFILGWWMDIVQGAWCVNEHTTVTKKNQPPTAAAQ